MQEDGSQVLPVCVIYGYVMTVILGIEHSNHKVAII